jgi:O-antigen/teichoic acid export membrane protein
MEDLKRKAVRGGFAKLCGQAASFTLRLGFMMVMARLLDPEDFGLVAMVTIVTGIYDLFTSAGLSAATVQQTTVTGEQVSTLFWINILVGTVLALLCLATAPILVLFYNEPRLFWVTIAMAAGFLFNASGVQHFALLQRQLRYISLTVLDAVSQLASYAIAIGMAVAGYGYWALVMSAIVAPAAMTAGMWAATAWIPGLPRRNVGIRPMLNFGTTVTLNGLVVYMAYNLDKLLLGRFWGADVLGVYGRAYQLINIPTANLNSAIGGVAFSALARLQNDSARLRSYFLKGYTLVVSLTIPMTIFCALFADDIVLLVLGPKWTEAATVFRLLSPTVLIFGIINPTSWLLMSIGMQRRSLMIAFVIAPLVAIALIIGLPYGPNGVAFAYSAAMMLWLVPHVFWCLHGTVVSPWDLFLATGRPLVACLFASVVVFGIQSYLGYWQLPVVRLLLGGGIMAGIYLGILLFVMGQKSFYFDLFKGLRTSTTST